MAEGTFMALSGKQPGLINEMNQYDQYLSGLPTESQETKDFQSVFSEWSTNPDYSSQEFSDWLETPEANAYISGKPIAQAVATVPAVVAGPAEATTTGRTITGLPLETENELRKAYSDVASKYYGQYEQYPIDFKTVYDNYSGSGSNLDFADWINTEEGIVSIYGEEARPASTAEQAGAEAPPDVIAQGKEAVAKWYGLLDPIYERLQTGDYGGAWDMIEQQQLDKANIWAEGERAKIREKLAEMGMTDEGLVLDQMQATENDIFTKLAELDRQLAIDKQDYVNAQEDRDYDRIQSIISGASTAANTIVGTEVAETLLPAQLEALQTSTGVDKATIEKIGADVWKINQMTPAELENLQASTGLTNAQITKLGIEARAMDLMMPYELEEKGVDIDLKRQQIANLIVQTDLTSTQIKSVLKDMDLTDAQINKMTEDISLSWAEHQLAEKYFTLKGVTEILNVPGAENLPPSALGDIVAWAFDNIGVRDINEWEPFKFSAQTGFEINRDETLSDSTYNGSQITDDEGNIYQLVWNGTKNELHLIDKDTGEVEDEETELKNIVTYQDNQIIQDAATGQSYIWVDDAKVLLTDGYLNPEDDDQMWLNGKWQKTMAENEIKEIDGVWQKWNGTELVTPEEGDEHPTDENKIWKEEIETLFNIDGEWLNPGSAMNKIRALGLNPDLNKYQTKTEITGGNWTDKPATVTEKTYDDYYKVPMTTDTFSAASDGDKNAIQAIADYFIDTAYTAADIDLIVERKGLPAEVISTIARELAVTKPATDLHDPTFGTNYYTYNNIKANDVYKADDGNIYYVDRIEFYDAPGTPNGQTAYLINLKTGEETSIKTN